MRPLLVVCWLMVALAVVFLGVHIYSMMTAPATQLDVSRRDGHVRAVVAGGAADRAGIRRGDRILSIGGEDLGPRTNPLFFRRAGETVPVVIERGGRNRTLPVTLVPVERVRQEGVQSDAGRGLLAINSYLSIPLNLWMLFLGIALLVLRPENKDARISALALVFWAGCSFFADSAGAGALFSSLPTAVRAAVYVIDAFFISAFFAACVHFAIVFPSEETSRVKPVWEVVAWLLALPIMIEWSLMGLRRLHPGPAARQGSDDIYLTLGPALLCLALAIMAVRFRRVSDLNSRRRLQLVFIALLPGALGFIFSVALSQSEAPFAWRQVGHMVNLLCTFIASGIYAYAVVRHRMYGIRVLVRRSIQYALARGTLAALTSLPLIGLIAFLYTRRRQSLDVLLMSMPAAYVLMLVPIVLAITYRRRLLDALDRRYFREQYDARQILLHVVSVVRGGSDMIGLSRVAIDEIDKALHPKHVSLWHLDAEEREFRRGFARGFDEKKAQPLPAFGALPALLATDDDPLDLQSRQTRTLVRRLPAAERDWLYDTGAHLLVPLVIEHKLAGIMVLGERMSEEPYSPEDRDLLRTVSGQLALTFDYSRLKSSPSLVWGQPSGLPMIPDEVRSCPTCGRCYPSDQTICEFDRRPLIREEGVPRIIDDKYVMTRVLGRGGMGTVYLATQMRLNRPVAIKVLLAHLVGSASMRSRFEREARIVARLRHPAIVTIHDFGLLPSAHAYLVMEYLQGETLRKVIFNGPIEVERMVEIISEAGDAIEAAHRAGVVHRDLKPENIMIVNDGNGPPSPRVLDFGLAKFIGPAGDDDVTLIHSTQSVGVVGTVMYMAPELLNGFTADARSDQYSLGLIAYELITGNHPFATANNLASVVRGHTEGIVPILGGVPTNVAEAIYRALAKDPEQRFASVGEFVAALER